MITTPTEAFIERVVAQVINHPARVVLVAHLGAFTVVLHERDQSHTIAVRAALERYTPAGVVCDVVVARDVLTQLEEIRAKSIERGLLIRELRIATRFWCSMFVMVLITATLIEVMHLAGWLLVLITATLIVVMRLAGWL